MALTLRAANCLLIRGPRGRARFPGSDIHIAFEGGDADGFMDDVRERLWSLLMVDAVDFGQRVRWAAR